MTRVGVFGGAMTTANWTVVLADDCRSVRIGLSLGDQTVAVSDMTADGLSGLIDMLATIRMQMVEEVPRDFESGSRLRAVIQDPVWRIATDDAGTGMRLALRHPGTGWTCYDLPEESVRTLAAWMRDNTP